MANAVNYAEMFEKELAQKYSRELLTADLTTEGARFMGAKTVRMPILTLAGFQEHNRDGGFNRRNVSNEYIMKTLGHDRDVEFFVDSMDVDDTSCALAAANLTNAFDQEFAIPETDAFRIAKLYQEYVGAGGLVGSVDVEDGVIDVFDTFMEEMDDAEVPEDGRVLYITPKAAKKLKAEAGLNRFVDAGGEVDRAVRTLDGVKVVVVPANRMKSAYTFTDGFAPAAGAKQVHMVLAHPMSVVAVCKHSYIKLWEPGTHTLGDGYLYQNRQYGDLFLIESRIGGVKIATA